MVCSPAAAACSLYMPEIQKWETNRIVAHKILKENTYRGQKSERIAGGEVSWLARREMWEPMRLKICWGSSCVCTYVCLSSSLFPFGIICFNNSVKRFVLPSCGQLLHLQVWSFTVTTRSLIGVCFFFPFRFCLIRPRGQSNSSFTPSSKSECLVSSQ